jgi:TfoX/Sxy family transcriptional regulator of competence genes
MPFDNALNNRVRHLLVRRRNIVEKKMFGGVGYLWKGNMVFGVWKTSIIVRVGADAYEEALRAPHVREFNITGRAMTGWVLIDPEGVVTDDQLHNWIDRALKFGSKLPSRSGAGK